MDPEPQPSTRAAEFRQALVATANLGPSVRRRPPLKLMIGSLAAFALAGALTGGAVATVTSVDPEVLSAQAGSADAARQYVQQEDGTLIGQPMIRSARGTQEINVGEMPSGATGLVEGFDCVDAGTFLGLLDSVKYESFPDCVPGGNAASTEPVQGSGGHVVTIQAPKSARFSIWLSWARIPQLGESAAQRQELSDGVVTRDEDLAAFSRYEGCMGALGHPIDGQSTSIVPGYTLDDSAVNDGSDNRCYVTEYRDVDEKWQLELEASTVGVASVVACEASGQVNTGHQPRAIVTLEGVLPNLAGCMWIG
jgi:hypothetical protein